MEAQSPASFAGDSAAWHDVDDAQLEVRLDSTVSTKRLRTSKGENGISAKSYVDRLACKAALSHPRPTWAAQKKYF